MACGGSVASCYQNRRGGNALSSSGSASLEWPCGHSKLTATPILSLWFAVTSQRTVPVLVCSSSRDKVVTHTRHGTSVVRHSAEASAAGTWATLLVMAALSAASQPMVTEVTSCGAVQDRLVRSGLLTGALSRI